MTAREPEEPNGQPPIKPLPSAVAFLGMGMSAAACVAVGVVLGVLGDDHWHTAPWLLVIGLVLGLAAAVGSVVTQIREYL
jgi:F0F1-type ATP synthase assembly protein I